MFSHDPFLWKNKRVFRIEPYTQITLTHSYVTFFIINDLLDMCLYYYLLMFYASSKTKCATLERNHAYSNQILARSFLTFSIINHETLTFSFIIFLCFMHFPKQSLSNFYKIHLNF